MNLNSLSLTDLVGVLVGFALTLSVFSYILGDNAIFRISLSIFVGVASGIAAVVAWYNVIWHQLIIPLAGGSQSEKLFALVPLLLSSIMLLKVSPRLARAGNPAVAYLVGVGVAAAIGGALTGTLFPQVWGSINMFDPGQLYQDSVLWQITKASLILLGTITTLAYFHYGVRPHAGPRPQRNPLIDWLADIGQVFIACALGAIFAGVYTAALTAFVERFYFIRDFVFGMLQL